MTPPAAGCSKRTVVLVLLGVFLVKAALLFVALPELSALFLGRYSLGFADLYDLIANNLSNGFGYRVDPTMTQTMVREPGYPLFLATVFRIGGYHIEAARAANLLLEMGVAFMLIRLTRLLTDDMTTALMATVLFLFHPGVMIAEARGGVEVAFLFVVMIFMLALYHAVEKERLGWYVVAGLVLGAVVLVRSIPMLFPVFLLGYLIVTARDNRGRLDATLRVGALVAAMAVVMLPWVVRNYSLVGQFVPTATVVGMSAQEGQYTCERLSSGGNFYTVESEAAQERNDLTRQLGIPFEGTYYQVFYSAADEVAFNRQLLQVVRSRYLEKPMLLPTCVAKNALRFWFLGKTSETTRLNVALEAPVLLLSIAGLFVAWKQRLVGRMGVMLTFAAYVYLTHLPIIAHARHSISVMPFVMILVSIAVMAAYRDYERRSAVRLAGSAAI